MPISSIFSMSVGDYAKLVSDMFCNFTSKCICNKTQIKCEGWIPDAVPDMIKEVVVTEINPAYHLYRRRFCKVSWPNVVKLAIFSSLKPVAMWLQDGVFDCLGQLRVFKLNTDSSLFLTSGSFSGLVNVVDFDVSECTYLDWSELLQVLSKKSNFPNLTHLRLAGAGRYKQLILMQEFVNAIALRPVTYLDISYVPSSLHFYTTDNLCNTLDTFIYRNAQIIKLAPPRYTCGSLSLLDVSGSDWFAREFEAITCVDSYFVYELDRFFSAVSVLYMNQMVITPGKFKISNCSFFLFSNAFVTEFHFSYNVLPGFDLMLVNNRLEYLDLSNNKIEKINELAFANLSQLDKLDVSHNHLHKIASNENHLPLLFAHNRKLRVLDLSSNGIPFLPDDIFISNELLQYLDLSRNLLEQVHFKLSHLHNMKYLDLSFNAIKRLDERSRQALDALVVSSLQLHTIRELNISLEGNPFSCDCESLPFLEWFVASAIFTFTRHTYQCQLEGKGIPINSAAVSVAEEDCDRIKRKRIAVLTSTIIPAVGVSVLFVVILILCKRRRRKKLRQQFEDRLRLLYENNLEYQFPVFLSYSSIDSEFVVQHVRQPLQVTG